MLSVVHRSRAAGVCQVTDEVAKAVQIFLCAFEGFRGVRKL